MKLLSTSKRLLKGHGKRKFKNGAWLGKVSYKLGKCMGFPFWRELWFSMCSMYNLNGSLGQVFNQCKFCIVCLKRFLFQSNVECTMWLCMLKRLMGWIWKNWKLKEAFEKTFVKDINLIQTSNIWNLCDDII
jgi:hypothetical protein